MCKCLFFSVNERLAGEYVPFLAKRSAFSPTVIADKTGHDTQNALA